MKRILLLIIICLPALFFTACNKELSDNFTTYPNTNPLNDTAWLRNVTGTSSVNELFDLLVPGGVWIDSFNITTGGTVRFGDSAEAVFTPNSCTFPGNSGGVVQGNVQLLILPLKTKGDFIKFFKPNTAANSSVLETAGGLYMRVLKDGQEGSLKAGQSVKVRFSVTDSLRADMQAFYGKEANPLPMRWMDTAFAWQRDTDTTRLLTWTKPGSGYKGYEINAKNLRWVAAEKYIDSTQAKTKVTAILSPNFTNKNTAVFAVFVNQKTVVNLGSDYASRSFFANNIPLKTAVRLVSLSKIGDDLYLGTENISSLDNTASHKINPEKKSLKDILTYLNSL